MPLLILAAFAGGCASPAASPADLLLLDPESPAAWGNRAQLRSLLGDQEGALADYALGLELSPDNTGLLFNRSVTRGRMGDGEGELEDLNRVIDLAPRDVRAWVNRSIVRRSSGDFQGAIADATRAIEVAPDPRPQLVGQSAKVCTVGVGSDASVRPVR